MELAQGHRHRLRRYALYGGVAVLGGVLAYRAYRSEAVAQTRASLARLRLALQRYSEALSSGADLCATLVRDLQHFLQADGSGEVPPTLRQLAVLLQSREVTQTTAATVSALYRGLADDVAQQQQLQQQGPGRGRQQGRQQQGALDKVLAALLSDRGQSLVSVAVSMGARNMVGALAEAQAQQAHRAAQAGQPEAGMVDRVLDFMATERGQALTVAAITAFVTNGVRAYMDATLDINFYEDIFSSMARPAHLEAVKQCVGMFAREAVGTALQGGSPPRPPPPPPSRRALIQELSPPPSPRALGDAATPSRAQQACECPESAEGRGSPLDSAFREGDSPSLLRRHLSGDTLGALGEDDEAASAASPPHPMQQLRHRGSGAAVGPATASAGGPADDLDSDSLLHTRREAGAKPPGGAGGEQPQQQAGAGGNLPWLPAVTREFLTVARDPSGRALMVGAAGAAAGSAAREVSVAAAAGLGQLEVTKRWGGRGLVALLLASFLLVCLVQELVRAVVLGVLAR